MEFFTGNGWRGRAIRRILFPAFMGLCGILHAGEYHWTGTGGDGRWTNPSNWRENAVPGQYSNTVDNVALLSGSLGDIAVFGAVTAGAATTIDLTDQCRVKRVVVTNGAPSYIFGTDRSDWRQRLGIESNGVICIAADVTADQLFNRPAMEPNSRMDFINDSITAVFAYRNLDSVTGKGGYPYGVHNLSGIGAFDFDGEVLFDQVSQLRVENAGALRLNDKSGYGARYSSVVFMYAGLGVHEVEIPADGRMTGKGGSFPWSHLFDFYGDTHIYGDGILAVTSPYNLPAGKSGWPHVLSVSSGRTAVFDCGIAARDHQPVDGMILDGSGTFLLNGTNTLSGRLRLLRSVKVGVRTFGMKGSPAGSASIPACDTIVYESYWEARSPLYEYQSKEVSASKLFYTGPGGGTDLSLLVSNTFVSVRATNTFANAGTGSFLLSSDILQSPETQGVTFRLAAETAPLVFSGTFEADRDWDVLIDGSDEVSVTTPQTYTGQTALMGGVLVLANRSVLPNTSNFMFCGGALRFTDTTEQRCVLPATFVSGANTIEIPAGMQLVLRDLTLPDGVTVNFVLPNEEGTFVTVSNAVAETLPVGVTWNGLKAKFNENGQIVPLRSAWKNAVNGNWNDAEKWDNGVPSAGDSALVQASGLSYTVTIDDTPIHEITDLRLANAAAEGTAEVRAVTPLKLSDAFIDIGNGGILSAHSGSELIVTNTSGGILNLWTNGLLKVYDGGTGTLVGVTGSAFNQDGGSIQASGSGRFQMGARFVFGTGSAVFSDTACMQSAGVGSLVLLKPLRAGDLSTLTFTNTARFLINQGYLRVCEDVAGGRAILNLNGTGSTKLYDSSNLYGLSLGYRAGYGEVNLTGGLLDIGNAGLFIGTEIDGLGSAGARVCETEGVFNMSGGSCTCFGYGWHYMSIICGCVIGNGSASESPTSFNRGTFNLSGGTFATRVGSTVVGAGRGEGVLFQTGGTLTHDSKNTWQNLSGVFPFVIGFSGGRGTYTMAGGTATVKTPMFVGGAAVADLMQTSRLSPFWSAHDAEGTLCVTGGMFSCNDISVGSDGTGTISLGGNGVINAENVVLSNATTSVLKFVLGENSTGRLNVNDTLVITDGARIVVDARAFSGHPVILPLAEAGAVSGTFADDAVEVLLPPGTRATLLPKILYSHNGVSGLWLKSPDDGTLMFLR